MITTLHIKNIGIIEDVNIDFNNGLNILTGETGAGKTLIIGSLQIISGGRFSKDMIRKGETNSFVEICMYVPNNKNAIDGNVIVSREININGKNMCKINGRMVTVNELKEFMSNIIEVHGQNDNQNLLDPKQHITYLDNFICDGIVQQKDEYHMLYIKYKEVEKKLKENYGDEKEKQRKLDLLKYQLNEIKEAELKINEDEELEEKRKLMLNSEKIVVNLNEADNYISENGVDILSSAIRSLEKIENIDEKYLKINSNLKNIYYELQEISRDLSNYKEDIYFDEEERNYIEERLDLITSLKRKYGNTIKEILEYKEKIHEEIIYIENLDEYILKLKKERAQIKLDIDKLGLAISEIRKIKSELLSKKINKELEELEMPNAKINVKVIYQENEFFENGKDIVEFYISTNKGEDEKQLIKIASGGEMSRTMLAIKKVLADSDDIPILIFDEIDTGISGKAANSVAKKLKSISKKHQVMCISHLPNIAAMADYNYFISKNINNDRTKTEIKLLSENETLCEIARISCGEINETSIKYAEELREKKVS